MTLEEFESTLDAVLADVDRALEERWAGRWPLHPARPAAGEAANPRYDGIIRVTAAFTAGYGSEKGPGYLLRIEPATLENVPAADRAALEDEAAVLVREGLAAAFPGRDLRVERDGGPYKVFGDLSLG